MRPSMTVSLTTRLSKIALTVALAISAVPALAASTGAPSEDPVVSVLRDRFHDAREPGDHKLSAKTYNCREYNATRGNFSVQPYRMTFNRFDGLFLCSAAPMIWNGSTYVRNGSEAITAVSYNGSLMTNAYRVDEAGNLLGETSAHTPGDMDRYEVAPYSAARDGSGVFSYAVCVPQN